MSTNVDTPTGAASSSGALTLTRDEASAITYELLWTADSQFIVEHLRDCDLDASTPEGARAAIADLQGVIDRLRLEASIRESGGWWGDRGPHWLDLRARYHEDAQCPDTFTLNGEGAAALREFCRERLPGAVAEQDENLASVDLAIEDRMAFERQRAGLVSLAARFGIEITADTAA
jgi:hypothetical protein